MLWSIYLKIDHAYCIHISSTNHTWLSPIFTDLTNLMNPFYTYDPSQAVNCSCALLVNDLKLWQLNASNHVLFYFTPLGSHHRSPPLRYSAYSLASEGNLRILYPPTDLCKHQLLIWVRDSYIGCEFSIVEDRYFSYREHARVFPYAVWAFSLI